MPAIPAIISGGAAIGSSLIGGMMGKKAASTAMEKTPQELAAFDANTKLAGQQTRQGNEMFNTAMPAVRNSLNYYGTLLGGNRAARVGAVAPEAESVSGAYEGANKAIGRSYISGGVKDQALAENARAKAGQIARLTTGVRPMAAQGMAQIAGSLIPQAEDRYRGASGIYGQQGNSEMANRKIGSDAGTQTSGNFGRLFAQILNITGKGKSGGGGFYPTGGGGGSSQPGDDAGWG